MADDRYYVPGSFYRIDDRTGFKVRAERTKKEWNGLIVREQSWEPRQPQDFVRGRKDQMTVPDARPRSPNSFIPISYTLPSLLASRDDQALSWPGVKAPNVMLQGVAPDVFLRVDGTSDLPGIYNTSTEETENPAEGIIDLGSVRSVIIRANMSYVGILHNDVVNPELYDLFLIQYLWSERDLFSPTGTDQTAVSSSPLVWTAFVWARIDIATANVADQWGPWDEFVFCEGIYSARYVKFRIVFGARDFSTDCFVTAFNWQIASI